MLLLRKIYCRAFQEVFHMAIPFLPYRKPALLHHTDALVPLFQKKGISCILLVTDPVVRGNLITQPLERALKQSGIIASKSSLSTSDIYSSFAIS